MGSPEYAGGKPISSKAVRLPIDPDEFLHNVFSCPKHDGEALTWDFKAEEFYCWSCRDKSSDA